MMRRPGPIQRNGRAPALRAAIALGAGIWAGAWSTSGQGLAAAAGLLCGIAALGSRSPGRRVFSFLFFLSAGMTAGRLRIGVPAAAAARAFLDLDRSQPAEWTGRIEGFWTAAGEGRFTTVRIAGVRQNGRVVALSTPAKLWMSGTSAIPAQRGDEFRTAATMTVPDIPASTRDLSTPFSEYSLSVKSALLMQRTRRTALSWISLPDEWLAGRLEESNLSDEVREPVSALLLGRWSSLDAGLAEDFRRGGMLHLLAISGLQIALIAGFLFFALGATPISRRTRDLVVLAATVGYAAAIGGRLPVVRSALTIGIILASRVIERPIAPLQAIGLSALIVLAIDPSDLWRAGFFITYGAAIGIAVFAPRIALGLRGIPSSVRLPIAVALAAQAALAPLVLWRFNLVSALSWLAAPLAVPIAGVLFASGGAILVALALGLSAAGPAAIFLFLERVLRWLARLTGKGTFLAATPPLAAVVALFAFLFLASRSSRLLRAAGIGGYLVLLGFLAIRVPANRRACDFSVEGLDVGQGDAFLLRSGGSAFLIDGGGRFDSADEEFGRTRLIPKLLDRGVLRLDGVMLSHPHPDHALGLFAALREMPVSALYLGDGRDSGGFWARLEAEARLRSIPVRRLRTGDRVGWGGGRFEILRSGGRVFKVDPINNESIVAVFEKAGRRVVFTGDSGAPAEQELLQGAASLPRVDLLKIGHHGSRSSSTPEFLGALGPREALLSCGRNNRFGHPSEQTMATLARLRIPVFRTDLRSDVGFDVTRDHLFLFERGIR